jgi:hypothetical protein
MQLLELPQHWHLRSRHVHSEPCWNMGVCGRSNWDLWGYGFQPNCAPRPRTTMSLGIFGTLFGLFLLHRRQRDQEREKRMQYWREQVRNTVCWLLSCFTAAYRMRSTKISCKCDKQLVRPFFPFPETGIVLAAPCTVVTECLQTKRRFSSTLRRKARACATTWPMTALNTRRG